MTSFRFPPPPPPPPKASSNDTQQASSSQRGGFNRARGERNNDRGGRGRGRGGNTPSFSGNSRGGYNQGVGRGNTNNRGARGHPNRGGGQARGGSHGQQNHMGSSTQSHGTNDSHGHSGAFMNAPFANLPQSGGMSQPQVDPNALAQAMSFMATPAGVQTMAALASHVANTGSLPFVPNSQQPTAPQYMQEHPRFSPSQHAGQKRKWEGRSNQGPSKSQQPGFKPPRAKAAVPPAVPSFGFSLATTQLAHPTKSQKANTKNNNARGKVKLGLTDRSLPAESSEDEEEEVDEEAASREKIKGGGYSFEHEGQQISLQTAADIASWIKDRRRNFPTAQKIGEKAEIAAAKRKHELEFIRKLQGKPPQTEVTEAPKARKMVQERPKEYQKKQEELAALRKKLHESMQAKKTTPTVDLGLGYGSETESEAESSMLSESSVVSSSNEVSEESSDGSDEAPESSSSKIAPPLINIPPPAPVPGQARSKQDKDKICQKYQKFGQCPFGNSCKFKHSYREEQRSSLYEKLVEQELVKSDRLALDAIKYLGQNGFLG